MKEMKQIRGWYGIIIALIFSVVFFLTILSVHRHFAGFIDGRPAEKLTAVLYSLDGLHTMEVYDNGGKGATVSFSSTVIISANPGGDQWKNKKKWCILIIFNDNIFISAKQLLIGSLQVAFIFTLTKVVLAFLINSCCTGSTFSGAVSN